MSLKIRADPTDSPKQHCWSCGAKEVRFLRRSKTIYCRVCGFEWPAPWVDPPKGKGGKK